MILKLAIIELSKGRDFNFNILIQVKSYIDNNLNPPKVNVIDPTKDNFTQLLSIKESLYGLQISKDDYYRALSISSDEDLELHLKRQLSSCFFNTVVISMLI